jgi:threonine dehydrogenase-like Zn-dependent dehydrogenase
MAFSISTSSSPAPGRPNVGTIAPTFEFPMTAFWSKQLSMRAGVVQPLVLAPQLVELVKSGRVRPGCVVSCVVGIDEVPEGYRRFNEGGETKVVVRFPWAGEW